MHYSTVMFESRYTYTHSHIIIFKTITRCISSDVFFLFVRSRLILFLHTHFVYAAQNEHAAAVFVCSGGLRLIAILVRLGDSLTIYNRTRMSYYWYLSICLSVSLHFGEISIVVTFVLNN